MFFDLQWSSISEKIGLVMKQILADVCLYGIVDMGYVSPEDVERVTTDLLQGGVRILQLRAKGVAPDAVEALAHRMQPLCRAAGAIFVLNDYPEMAARIGADAVHVGQDGGSLEAVRAIVGPDMIIGRSTHSPEQALAAVAEGADYIGFGPLFPTGTKPGRPAIGLQDIATVQEQLGDFPMFCIGGINGSTLPTVLTAGARRVVIVSWLLRQADVAGAAQNVIARMQ